MPHPDLAQLRQRLNDMKRRHPDDPYIGLRVDQIRENLRGLEFSSEVGPLERCAMSIVELDQHMKAKREG